MRARAKAGLRGSSASVLLALTVTSLAASIGCSRSEKPNAESTPAVTAATAVGAPASAAPSAKPVKVEIPEILVRPDAPTTVLVAWNAPEGTTVNDDAPFRVRWTRSEGLAEAPADMKSTGNAVREGFKVQVQPTNPTAARLVGDVDLVVCDTQTHAVCLPVHRTVEFDFFPEKSAPAEVKVSVPLPAARS